MDLLKNIARKREIKKRERRITSEFANALAQFLTSNIVSELKSNYLRQVEIEQFGLICSQ